MFVDFSKEEAEQQTIEFRTTWITPKLFTNTVGLDMLLFDHTGSCRGARRSNLGQGTPEAVKRKLQLKPTTRQTISIFYLFILFRFQSFEHYFGYWPRRLEMMLMYKKGRSRLKFMKRIWVLIWFLSLLMPWLMADSRSRITSFPNTSKVVLLFHEIEGVELCLFWHVCSGVGFSPDQNARQRLDGDYFPGAAEDTINQLRQEEDGSKLQKKGKSKKTYHNKAIKAAGQTDLSANASKAVLLMQQVIYSPSAATGPQVCKTIIIIFFFFFRTKSVIFFFTACFATNVLTMASLYFPNGFQYVLHANLVIMGYSRGNVWASVVLPNQSTFFQGTKNLDPQRGSTERKRSQNNFKREAVRALGVVHLKVLSNFTINCPCSYMEMDVEWSVCSFKRHTREIKVVGTEQIRISGILYSAA
ncbi:hypothetical protein MKW98_007354 [Papaver atlanticum]|uniref:histone acetyltransferase n=1 Tax=Papaver atlanticum TaxID=357466 RepID=A0AAD4SD23_9MAGN|nr:hypothetical protein MKW98_007354 [Papaver atlanticum]